MEYCYSGIMDGRGCLTTGESSGRRYELTRVFYRCNVMASISEGRQYLRLRESKMTEQNTNLLQPDGSAPPGLPLGLGGSVGGKEGFTDFMGPTAAIAVNRKEAQEVRAMEDDFNSSLSRFARTQAQVMDDTRQFVGVTAPGQNRYSRQKLGHVWSPAGTL